MIEPITFRVVIKPDPIKEVTKSGIILAVDKKLEEGAAQTGTIVGLGPDVFAAFKPSVKYGGLEVGQRVAFAKYAGKWVEDPETKISYLVVNDEDVVVILKGEPSDSPSEVETVTA